MAEEGAEELKKQLEEAQKELQETKDLLEAERSKNEELQKERAELSAQLETEKGSKKSAEVAGAEEGAEPSAAGEPAAQAGGERTEDEGAEGQRAEDSLDADAGRDNGGEVQGENSVVASVERSIMEMSLEELQAELQRARDKIAEMEEYQMELDGVADNLQQQLEEERSLRGLGDDEVYQAQERKLKEKDKFIKQLRSDVSRLESELAQAEGKSPRKDDEGGEIPYDVLDRLDDELARAKEQLLERESECGELKHEVENLRKQLETTDEWRESAVQAQHECRMVKDDLKKALKDGAEEQHMRQALEARFEEKVKLKTREVEHLSNEVDRLKRASEQISPILTELENLKMESRHKLEHKNKEISRLQSALQIAEAERQKSDNEIRNMKMDIEQWEKRVKNAEEVRWRAGMNLAKAKAEMDWRQKADQEKDFFMERMKEELTRLKNKLMRTEMRKLKVEESLEETVMELRGKKREMEQMKARVDGLVRAMQVQPSGV